MNKLDKQYTDLLQDILDNGVKKGDRTGTGTISVFGRQIRHKMKDGFPLITTKKMFWKGIVTELIWFLRGDTNIKYLVDNDCHIWDGDAYKNYQTEWLKENPPFNGPYTDPCLTQEEFINKIKTDDEFAKKLGDLGPIYGKQWRRWSGYDKIPSSYNHGSITHYKEVPKNDQIANLINDLKTNPDSRRLMVNAWNVGELEQMVLPPCHYGFQVYTRELSELERHDIKEQYGFDCRKLAKPSIKQLDDANIPRRAISLMWSQRSCDIFLGIPFNIASYGLLLEIIAKAVNMVPDELIGNLGDVHLYSNHIEQAKEQIGRELQIHERVCMCYENPSLDLNRLQEEMYDYQFESVCDEFDIPKRTRIPFELPTLEINSGNKNWHLLEIDEIINSLDSDITFKIDNYQSHPTIKAPLSN
jgi:thymidylate synthase